MNREIAVASSLLDGIRESNLTPGQRLPDERSHVKQLGVSRTTLRRAMKRLENNGIVERRQGSGTYLLKKPTQSQINVILEPASGVKRSHSNVAALRRRIVMQKVYRFAFFHDRHPEEPRIADILTAACGFAHNKGHEMLVGASRPTHASVVHRDFTNAVYRPDADGIVLSATLRRHDIANLAKIPVPYVLYTPVVPADESVGAVNNAISLDLPAACRHAVGEMIRQGHKHIAVLEKLHPHQTPKLEHVSSFLQKEVAGELSYFADADPYELLTEEGTPVSSLFVSDDTYCLDVCNELREQGKIIGSDISVTSIAVRGITTDLPPQVSRMEFDMKEVGLILMQRLERLLDEGKRTFAPMRIGAEYVPGR